MNNAIITYLEAVCAAIAILWDTLCYPVRALRNQAIDYGNMDTGDFVYEPLPEDVAEYQRICTELTR